MDEIVFNDDFGYWWVILLLMLFSGDPNFEKAIEEYKQEQENN